MARAPKSSPAKAPPTALELRLAWLLVWLLAIAVPFVFLRTSHDSFRLPKLVVAEALALASVLALAIAWAHRRFSDPLRETWLGVASVLGPILGVAALGLGFGDHPAHLRQTLAALAIGLGAAAAWALFFERERLARLLAWSVLPGVGLALVGIGQHHDLFQPFSFEKVREGTRLAVTSLAGNAGELGGFLLLPALVAQWRIVAEPRRRWLWIAALGVIVYGQIASQTLTALAALLAGSAVFWLLSVPAQRRGLVVGGALAATLLVALAAPPVRSRIATIGDGLTVGRLNAALSGRLDGWRVAGHVFAEHPWTGVGLGGFAPEFAPARLALLKRGVDFFPGHTEAFFSNAHNDLLEWLAETGLPGLVALGVALWSLVSRVKRFDGPDRAFAWAALTALTLLALAYFPLRVPLLAYPILLFLAWALSSTKAEEVSP